jgi:hypothetical protein
MKLKVGRSRAAARTGRHDVALLHGVPLGVGVTQQVWEGRGGELNAHRNRPRKHSENHAHASPLPPPPSLRTRNRRYTCIGATMTHVCEQAGV